MFKKLNDIIDILSGDNGIFYALKTLNKFTWLNDTLSSQLDLDYYLNHSGNKYISHFTDVLYKNNPSTYLTLLADVIYNRYGDNWNKIYDAYFNNDYNPIENYSMIEEENQNTDMETTLKNKNNVYGFNTSSDTGISNNYQDNTTNVKGKFDDNHRKLTRSGNIGVTTSQQMLESEIDLRKFDFYQMIMNDIDNIMCLMVR